MARAMAQRCRCPPLSCSPFNPTRSDHCLSERMLWSYDSCYPLGVHANNLIDLDLSLGWGRKSGLRKTVWSCLHPSTFPKPWSIISSLKVPCQKVSSLQYLSFQTTTKKYLSSSNSGHHCGYQPPRAIKDIIHVRQARCLDNFLVSGLKLGTCFRRWLVGGFDCRKCMKMIFDVNIHPRERGKQCITTTFNNSMNRWIKQGWRMKSKTTWLAAHKFPCDNKPERGLTKTLLGMPCRMLPALSI